MTISDALQLLSVLIEAIIVVTAIAIAVRKGKTYGWFIALTFALFVFFDLARIFTLAVPNLIHSIVFLVACVSMLYTVWLIYKEK